ncbi:MAG: NDP-sugar synthase [Actinomycetota bacterium]|nr:NDP-sugar synthase [Actinomycetota bacterium]
MTLHAVILAGGRGTRLAPLTDRTPKPLLPVAGLPVVAHQLVMLAALDVSRVLLTTSYRAQQFRDVLGTGGAWGLELDYCREDAPLGTGGALAAAVDRLAPANGDVLLVLNGDQLSAHDVAAQLNAFAAVRSRLGAVGTLHAKPVADARAYGLIEVGAAGRITAFREKPEELVGGIVNAGTYLLDPSCLDGVSRRQPVSFERDVIPALLRAGGVLTAYVEDAYSMDIGTPATLIAASRDAVLRHGPAIIDPAASVDPSARVRDGSYVGPGAVIAANCDVRGTIVMARARLDAGVLADSCAFGPGAQVDGPASLHDVVLGAHAYVGAGHPLRPGARVPTAAILR